MVMRYVEIRCREPDISQDEEEEKKTGKGTHTQKKVGGVT